MTLYVYVHKDRYYPGSCHRLRSVYVLKIIIMMKRVYESFTCLSSSLPSSPRLKYKLLKPALMSFMLMAQIIISTSMLS